MSASRLPALDPLPLAPELLSVDHAAAKRIGFLGFDGVAALDLTGPMEAFSAVRVDTPQGTSRPGYTLFVLGLTPHRFVTESGLSFRPDRPLRAVPELDTLVVPGGRGIRDPLTNAKLAAWLKQHAGRFRRVLSVGTGIYALAPTGMLDGRRVTTHWRYARDVAERYPELRVEPDEMVVRDGAFHTSAGITAGIDLALALIEDDYGSAVALSVARELVTYLKRPGGQDQFSEPGVVVARGDDRLSELASWISTHLADDLSVEALSKRLEMSSRHFTRLFTKAFARSPALMIEDMRLDEARRRLVLPNASIDTVAESVGFRNPDTFRRTFLRRLGVSPSYYRNRFGPRSRTVRGAVRPVALD